ncbi:hypothetical protein M4951_12455 [Blastopirellula sp. J2-11]|uniref:hypothetical protein n=1 Tax=Blastopirellula sp. J2-11 TaxID=2943192 RepID=UPI0021C89A21|nr:hypothetical protein [Blastopirellula sp. J2-11]UUO09095.1 hypothetical protein M4951_12455 [Blastopirellula sp. J2-11]
MRFLTLLQLRTTLASVFAILTIAVTICGCESAENPLTAVHGKVTLDGQPITNGQITFHPIGGDSNRPAIGRINQNGEYVMSTYAAGDGVLSGEYLVLIDTSTDGPTIEDPKRREKWLAPKHYADANTSKLRISIPSDRQGEVTQDFDLKK